MNNEITQKEYKFKVVQYILSFCMSNELVGTLTVYSDILRGDKSLAKYFASWCDAVLILEIIGRIGILCILAVP